METQLKLYEVIIINKNVKDKQVITIRLTKQRESFTVFNQWQYNLKYDFIKTFLTNYS